MGRNEGLRKRLRRSTPPWLKQRLIPFECELERRAVEFCSGYRNARLLDVGCGAITYHPAAIGIDIDFDTLSRLQGFGVCGDAHCLPVRSESAEAICCSGALNHFRDPARTLEEMRRCLRPGGRLFLSVPCRFPRTDQPNDWHRFNRNSLVELLQRTGWVIEDCVPVGGRYWTFARHFLEALFHFRMPLLVPAVATLGIAVPLACFYLDRLDSTRDTTLGWVVIGRKRFPFHHRDLETRKVIR